MSFREIIGQDKAINFLINSFKNQKIGHAYLFVGPPGVGKSQVAAEFAKLLNCDKKANYPCDTCISCRKIDNFNHPDVYWVKKDDSGFIKIDAIRQLSRQVALRPLEARKKVFIIKDAQLMTEEATNALLKTLEEPFPDNILILTATKLDLLFPTIVSRCRKIFFSALNIVDLEKMLEEKFNLNKDKALFLSRFSQGSLSKAVEFKDKNIFVKRNEIFNHILTKTNLEFIDKDEAKDTIKILISILRDILVLKYDYSLDIINIDWKEDLLKLKDKFSFDELEDTILNFTNLESLLVYNINPKFILDLINLKCMK